LRIDYGPGYRVYARAKGMARVARDAGLKICEGFGRVPNVTSLVWGAVEKLSLK